MVFLFIAVCSWYCKTEDFLSSWKDSSTQIFTVFQNHENSWLQPFQTSWATNPHPDFGSSDYKIFVINMKDTDTGERRWKRMKETLFAKQMQRFPAIHGAKYDYRKEIENGIVTKTWDYGKWRTGTSEVINMTDGEIGVSLSHYYVWRKIIRENIEEAIILEDDSYKIAPNFEKKLMTIRKSVPADWDIILLSFWLHRGSQGEKKINDRITKVNKFVLFNAYIINQRACKKLMTYLPINMPIDSWISQHTDKLVVYRHHFTLGTSRSLAGRLIMQDKEHTTSSIVHTNNW